jgi:aryl-alcohol dehydrogenase-like predicted oxidoreductase
MRYRPLGLTGIHVSPYCLGTMMFGAVGNPDHADCIRIIHRALDAGINVVDTADVYSRGESEEIVGKAIAGRRDRIVVATKAGLPMGDDPNERGSSRRWIVRAVENSLRRLGTDVIDLFQIHRPVPDTDIEETLSALTDLIRAGKIRAIGTSTFPASQIVEAHWVAERRGFARFRTEQPSYSLLNRGIEREILPVCQAYGMGVMVWSPLAMGLLTGRYREEGVDSARRRFNPAYFADAVKRAAVEGLAALADEAGMPLGHLAMAFAIAHPGVTAAILGPRTLTQLDDLIAGAEVTLGDDLLDRIDAVVSPGGDVGPLHAPYVAPALATPALRRRPQPERAAA